MLDYVQQMISKPRTGATELQTKPRVFLKCSGKERNQRYFESQKSTAAFKEGPGFTGPTNLTAPMGLKMFTNFGTLLFYFSIFVSFFNIDLFPTQGYL
jgi:hypothetical protein